MNHFNSVMCLEGNNSKRTLALHDVILKLHAPHFQKQKAAYSSDQKEKTAYTKIRYSNDMKSFGD